MQVSFLKKRIKKKCTYNTFGRHYVTWNKKKEVEKKKKKKKKKKKTSELSSCVEVEVDILGSPSLKVMVLVVSVDVW